MGLRKGEQHFRKGESGNPKGRPPKKDCIRDCLRELLAEEITLPDGTKITKAQFVAAKAFSLVAQGELPAIKYISDQVDGTPKQQVEVSGAEGGPLQHSVEVRFVDPTPPVG